MYYYKILQSTGTVETDTSIYNNIRKTLKLILQSLNKDLNNFQIDGD